MVPVIPLLALAFGVLVGFATQLVASRLRYNGDWDAVPIGRKIAMSGTGALAAFITGLWILDNPVLDSGTPFVYRLWLWQTVAAWGGSVLLDGWVNLMRKISRDP